MADKSNIEWTDATWNPITGCSVVSPGCTNCYAMRLAGTRLAHHPSRAGLTTDSKSGPVWNGHVRLNEQWLDQPLRWRRPRRIFVCAHGDLFHPAVPDEWIDRVFAVMGECPQHTFQVLTKRAARMREYLTARKSAPQIAVPITDGLLAQHPFNSELQPPANIWLGVSAEDQPRADERIPHLLNTPAAVRFVSAEPLLGPLVLTATIWRAADGDLCQLDALAGELWASGFCDPDHTPSLDWVIVGGESGPGARPMHPQWARDLRDQCVAAGVPFFMKQLSGERGKTIKDISAFPLDLQVRKFPQ